MALFVGGPYDGMDLEYDPQIFKRVNLPERDQFEESMVVNSDTNDQRWPHIYEADFTVTPAVYRYWKR